MTDITITEGDTLEVDYEVENVGDGTGDQDIRLTVQDVLEDTDADVALDPGQTATGTLQWPTESGDEVTDALAEVASNDSTDGITVTVEPLSPFPDSAIARFYGPETGFSNDQVVDPWTDTIGTNDIDAASSPVLNTESLNGVDAVDTSQNNGYYNWNNPDVSAPATLIWGFELNGTSDNDHMLLIDGGDSVQINITDYQINWGGTSASGGNVTNGDTIMSFVVDSNGNASLRVNGSEVVTNSGRTTMLPNGADLFNDSRNTGRVPKLLLGEVMVYDDALSGSELADEEARIENNLGMAVL